MKIDSTDRQILALLQENAERNVNEIAAQVNLSATPCWRRIQRMKEAGIISKQVALLDPRRINLGVTVFVLVKTNQHNQQWFDSFYAAVKAIPEVMEFYRVSGDIDYLLRVVVPDIAAYDRVYKRLTETTVLFDVSSSFSMEEIKFTTSLPLTYA